MYLTDLHDALAITAKEKANEAFQTYLREQGVNGPPVQPFTMPLPLTEGRPFEFQVDQGKIRRYQIPEATLQEIAKQGVLAAIKERPRDFALLVVNAEKSGFRLFNK